MPTKNSDFDPVDLAVVAHFMLEGMTNAQIGRLLQIPEATMTKICKSVMTSKILTVSEHELRRRKIITKFKKRLEELDLSRKLDQRPWAKGMCKFIAFMTADARDFEQQAGEKLAQLIINTQNEYVGLMWGGVIERILQVLAERFSRPVAKPRGKKGFKSCIPLCGEPTGVVRNSAPRFSSSYLAAEFHRIMATRNKRSDEATQYILTGIPAYIPTASRNESIMQFIRHTPSYRHIFEGADALADKMDICVTGLGAFDPNGDDGPDGITGIFLRERIVLEAEHQGDISKRLRDCTSGDVGGWLAPRPGISESDKAFVDDLNDGWTGATLNHLRRCYDEREDLHVEREKNAGVIGVARGAHKKEVVRYAVENKLLNFVICDLSLAEALRNA